eukprot:TRINITY_DN25572_c0_g1_i1.p1 TRINITY_DN25572_c0_g1~~TRINITY_DN25572_c0_g1_i1.p1  ORF type:complete len:218 (+),score=42.43 TRINITY_DN25572_c0_g1_i1:138-791(+)
MGAGKSSAMCCGNQGMPCCTKNSNGGKGAEIVRARPVDYPGLSNDDQLLKGAAPKDAEEATTADQGDKEETYEDGSTYVGQLVDGRRHGSGVWTSPSEQYSGQWKADQRDGQGRQTWQDGRLYDGQFSDGKFDGHGRMEWHTPHGLMVYEGQYVNDVKHGTGKYKWPDNRIYDGQWVQGKRSGKATYTNLSGEVKHGVWKDDRIERWLDDASAAESK